MQKHMRVNRAEIQSAIYILRCTEPNRYLCFFRALLITKTTMNHKTIYRGPPICNRDMRNASCSFIAFWMAVVYYKFQEKSIARIILVTGSLMRSRWIRKCLLSPGNWDNIVTLPGKIHGIALLTLGFWVTESKFWTSH